MWIFKLVPGLQVNNQEKVDDDDGTVWELVFEALCNHLEKMYPLRVVLIEWAWNNFSYLFSPPHCRYNKCMSCYSQLVPIKAFVLKRQAVAGKLGQTFRELHLLLQIFEWFCPIICWQLLTAKKIRSFLCRGHGNAKTADFQLGRFIVWWNRWCKRDKSNANSEQIVPTSVQTGRI